MSFFHLNEIQIGAPFRIRDVKCSIMRLVAAGLMLTLATAKVGASEFIPYARGSFAELRKQHAGRPLVIHFWSVNCPPCLAELPDWATIARNKTSIEIIFVNVDRDTDRARAQSRLDKAGLSNLAHYGFADDFLERLYFEADPTWRGELPFTALIGPDGALETVIGPIDDPLVGDWLAQAGR